jgi:formylglycine-generating enzyme required for sulfatase activity
LAEELLNLIYSLENIASPKQHQKFVTKKIIFLPDIDWVDIPAGSFIYGEGETQQTLTLERFYIARYPVTNYQYQCFIDDGGYQDERWWLDLVKPEPAEPHWKQSNRPREKVDWYEAMAFCRWLSYRLGFTISLPTEQQWEKAARGTDGRDYPWGNEIKTGDANVFDESAGEDNLKTTCAVGLYPHRQSAFGIADMAGNVWEWCLTKNSSPDQIKPDTSGDNRGLRGGAWNFGPHDARSADRLGLFNVNRKGYVGFRVVCSSPSSAL